MSFYVSSDSYSNLRDPAYREKYKEMFLRAQKYGMDLVIYPDGTIALIENRIAIYPYAWNGKKRDFERAKFKGEDSKKRRNVKKKSGVQPVISGVEYFREEELVN